MIDHDQPLRISAPRTTTRNALWCRMGATALASKVPLRIVLMAVCLICAGAAGAADRASGRPMRMVVPFPPGGGLDTVARVVVDKLGERLSRPVVVDNRPGASGSIGAGIVAKAAPDGNTVLMTSSSSLATNPALQRLPPEAITKEFSPVSLVSSTSYVLVVHPSVPAKTVLEFLQLAKSAPRRVTYSSSGTGTASHLAMELLKYLAGIEVVHVPYKGSSPAVIGLMSGEVQVGFNNLIPALPHVKSGKLRALGISGAARWAAMSDVPTIAESGVPGYEAVQWYAMLLPAGAPRDLVQQFYRELNTVLGLPAVRERLMKDGSVVIASTPEYLSNYIASEIAKWTKVVVATQISVN